MGFRKKDGGTTFYKTTWVNFFEFRDMKKFS